MRRTVTILVCIGAVLALGTVGAQDDGVEANRTGSGLALGEEISVIISAQGAGVRDTVERGAFEIEFERRGVAAVDERVRELEERLERVRERKEEIRSERDRGNISERRYRAKMTQLSLDSESVNRSADMVLEKATGLERAGEQGVNVENIRRLKANASNLTGREVSEIARGIAGPPEGVGDRRGPPDGVVRGNETQGAQGNFTEGQGEPPERARNRTDRDANRTGRGNEDAEDRHPTGVREESGRR
jgi:hypothetical protein